MAGGSQRRYSLDDYFAVDASSAIRHVITDVRAQFKEKPGRYGNSNSTRSPGRSASMAVVICEV